MLQNFYNKREIEDFIRKRAEFISYPDKNTNSAYGSALSINEELCKYWNDKRLINIYQKVLNQKIYARSYPKFQFVQPRSKKWYFAKYWHFVALPFRPHITNKRGHVSITSDRTKF